MWNTIPAWCEPAWAQSQGRPRFVAFGCNSFCGLGYGLSLSQSRCLYELPERNKNNIVGSGGEGEKKKLPVFLQQESRKTKWDCMHIGESKSIRVILLQTMPELDVMQKIHDFIREMCTFKMTQIMQGQRKERQAGQLISSSAEVQPVSVIHLFQHHIRTHSLHVSPERSTRHQILNFNHR